MLSHESNSTAPVPGKLTKHAGQRIPRLIFYGQAGVEHAEKTRLIDAMVQFAVLAGVEPLVEETHFVKNASAVCDRHAQCGDFGSAP